MMCLGITVPDDDNDSNGKGDENENPSDGQTNNKTHHVSCIGTNIHVNSYQNIVTHSKLLPPSCAQSAQPGKIIFPYPRLVCMYVCIYVCSHISCSLGVAYTCKMYGHNITCPLAIFRMLCCLAAARTL